MEQPPIQRSNLPFDWDELKWIAAQSFRSNPRYFQNLRTQRMGEGWEPSILEDVMGSSPLLDYSRQHLPATVGDTRLGQALPWNTPEWVRNVPLGGYSTERMQSFTEARKEYPNLRANTVHKDVTPEFDRPTVDVPIGDSGRRKAAQALGTTAADVVGVQGLMHLWWLMNAGEAVSSVATLQALHGAQEGISSVRTPLLKSRPMRMAATAPAWIAMKFGNGSFGRLDGYTAASPSADDPTQPSSGIEELLSELVLGRSGNLLPYRDFVQERPDVSKGEYEAYKAFLHGNKSPIKATLDGIHGPEINFLGKSLPVLTAVLPAVAMAAGGRYGARRAARRLVDNGVNPVTGEIGVDLLQERQKAFKAFNELDGNSLMERHGADADSRADSRGSKAYVLDEKELAAKKQDRFEAYEKINRAVESEVLKDVMLYGGGALTATALIGSTLEQVRRAMKGRAPIEEEEEMPPVQTPAPTAQPRPASGGMR
jgi:hypothetical protein